MSVYFVRLVVLAALVLAAQKDKIKIKTIPHPRRLAVTPGPPGRGGEGQMTK